jgi:hypothetical protein
MFEQSRTIAAKLGVNLIKLDQQPISAAALIIVVFLDLFILVSIFSGLDDHTGQLTSPDELIPDHCRNIVIDGNWNETNQLTRIADIASAYRNSYTRSLATNHQQLHSGCVEATELISRIKNSKATAKELSDLTKMTDQISQTNQGLAQVNDAYQTSLLENIANRPDQNNPAGVSAAVTKGASNLDSLITERDKLAKSLAAKPSISTLFEYIDSVDEQQRERLITDLRAANFWFPVKRLGMELAFLLPLVLVFWFWNSRSIVANRPLQVLVTSHLLVVVFIPVIFKVTELVYDILPRKLLEKVITILESLHLIALWHYFLMAAAIILALALIYLFQQRLFSYEKSLQKRIAKGQCQDCGSKLPAGCEACPHCGFHQFENCSSCDQPTYVHARYCIACGVERNNEKANETVESPPG